MGGLGLLRERHSTKFKKASNLFPRRLQGVRRHARPWQSSFQPPFFKTLLPSQETLDVVCSVGFVNGSGAFAFVDAIFGRTRRRTTIALGWRDLHGLLLKIDFHCFSCFGIIHRSMCGLVVSPRKCPILRPNLKFLARAAELR